MTINPGTNITPATRMSSRFVERPRLICLEINPETKPGNIIQQVKSVTMEVNAPRRSLRRPNVINAPAKNNKTNAPPPNVVSRSATIGLALMIVSVVCVPSASGGLYGFSKSDGLEKESPFMSSFRSGPIQDVVESQGHGFR